MLTSSLSRDCRLALSAHLSRHTDTLYKYRRMTHQYIVVAGLLRVVFSRPEYVPVNRDVSSPFTRINFKSRSNFSRMTRRSACGVFFRVNRLNYREALSRLLRCLATYILSELCTRFSAFVNKIQLLVILHDDTRLPIRRGYYRYN